MIYVRNYIDSDLDEIVLRPRDEMQSEVDNTKWMAGISTRSYTMRRISDDVVVAICGHHIVWDHVAQGWMMVSDEMRGSGIAFVKALRKIIEYDAKQLEIRRYHVVINRAIEENIRFIRLLGFEYEFTMYCAAPDGNHLDGYVYWCNKGDCHGEIRTKGTTSRLEGHVDECESVSN